MGRNRARKPQANANRSVRIVAGRWSGRTLKAPAASTTRPTTDRVKEAMMSAIFSARGFEGAWVLDPFAGSGALGLEALSRGAEHLRLCEADRAAYRIVRTNIDILPGAAERTELLRGDAFKVAGAPTPRAFDLVLLDPPYATPTARVMGLVEQLYQSGVVAPDALVCYEHAESDDSTLRGECERIQWKTLKTKTYGEIAYSLIRRERE